MKRSVNFSRQRKPANAKQLRRALDLIGLTEQDRKEIRARLEAKEKAQRAERRS